jgi:hypothetical protein
MKVIEGGIKVDREGLDVQARRGYLVPKAGKKKK